MKAGELRLGNLIHVDKNTLVEIESISEIGANLRHGSETIYFDDLSGLGDKSHDVIKPIPLTEEWLLKFGFEYYDIVSPKGYWRGGICIEKIDAMLIEFKNGIGLKYVHQLQNLYFALTGEELTLHQES